MSRYHVKTCTGYFSITSKVEGTSAYVIDSMRSSEVVATFRSEGQDKNLKQAIKTDIAVHEAVAYAQELNKSE